MSQTQGFILDCFAGIRAGRAVTYAIGRLETGETFGLVDDRRVPTLFVRISDAGRVPSGAAVTPTSLVTMDGEPVVALLTADQGQLRHLDGLLRSAGTRTYEGDIDFALGYLTAHGLRGSVAIEGTVQASEHVARVYLNPIVTPGTWDPVLRVLSFDIEIDVATKRVLAVSLVLYGYGQPSEEVLVLGEHRAEDPPWLMACESEPALLAAFATRVRALDPDVLTGWNIIDFDLPVLAQRFACHGMAWNLGRSKQAPLIGRRRVPPIQGRQVLDALRLTRSSSLRFDDLRLGTVAQATLGRTKLIETAEGDDKPAKIMETYSKDRLAFATYCLEDARLVRDILVKEKLIELAVSRTRLIGLPLEKNFGSIASFDLIYMTQLRRRGYVAPSKDVDRSRHGDAPGGLVLEPMPGLYEHILVFDFRSLYPSIIRTFNIDPLAHAQALASTGGSEIVAPNGAPFSRVRGILPEMLDRFFVSRADALRSGDKVAAYAYKIIMNSFYGVLGTDSCRFASPALAGAITGFGHLLLRWTRAHFEEQGFTVLYGDTDSLFVSAGLGARVTPRDSVARGAELAARATQALAAYVENDYGTESLLELKFEKYYRWFLLPKSRGGGSRAKSYAGQKQDERGEALEVVGMEAVRSDWTQLARELQLELLGLLFSGASAQTLEARVRGVVAEVVAGKKDAQLIYRKRIRKELSSYTSTTPPQIKAARLLPRPTRTVRYVITDQGPQPCGFVTGRLDYGHYITKQISPIVEMLGELAGFNAAAACSMPGRRSLFGD